MLTPKKMLDGKKLLYNAFKKVNKNPDYNIYFVHILKIILYPISRKFQFLLFNKILYTL
jgi:hypothetical protein